jgi:hypothetical protein
LRYFNLLPGTGSPIEKAAAFPLQLCRY